MPFHKNNVCLMVCFFFLMAIQGQATTVNNGADKKSILVNESQHSSLIDNERQKTFSQKDKDLFNTIQNAIFHKQFELFKNLLSTVTNYHVTDSHGNTLLAICLLYGSLDYLEVAFDYPFDVMAVNQDKNNLVHLAAQMGRYDVLPLLKAKNIDFNAENKEGQTPLIISIYYGHNFFTSKLLQYPLDVNHQDLYGLTALHIAAYRGMNNLCDWLLNKKAQINIKDFDAITPLHYAAGNGNLLTVKLLVESGANVNSQDKKGGTPLYNAVVENQHDIVNYLLSQKADLKVLNNDRQNLLQAAIYYKKMSMALRLLDFPFDPNYQDKYGKTALHYALLNGFWCLVEKLAPITTVFVSDSLGISDSMLAIQKITDPLILNQFFDKKIDWHQKDKNGNNLGHYIALFNRDNLISVLDHHQVSFFEKNKNGETPLTLGIKKHNIDVYVYVYHHYQNNIIKDDHLAHQLLDILSSQNYYYYARQLKKDLWQYQKSLNIESKKKVSGHKVSKKHKIKKKEKDG